MCATFQTDEDDLSIALRNLDAAKAHLRTRQAELSDAARPAYVGCSLDTLDTFESRQLAMNEAAERYRRALGAFDVVCQKYRLSIVRTSEPNVMECRRIRSAVRTNLAPRKQRFGLRNGAPQVSKPAGGMPKDLMED